MENNSQFNQKVDEWSMRDMVEDRDKMFKQMTTKAPANTQVLEPQEIRSVFIYDIGWLAKTPQDHEDMSPEWIIVVSLTQVF